MKILIPVLAILFSGFASPQAYAASCDAAAARLAASKGGRVLSVRAKGNKCTVKLLIKSRSGAPKRKTFVIRG